MNYSVTIFKPQDLPDLLAFLNANWTYDQITEAVLREKLEGDPDWMPEGALMCRYGNVLIGFMQGVMRHISGTHYAYIKLMAVDEAYRRKGIATLLYAKLEAIFIKNKADVVRIYDVPLNYFMPGIDPRYTPALCWAMRKGFERFGDTSNLDVDLNQNWNTFDEELALKLDNIDIRRARLDEKAAVLKFVEDKWALWRNEVEEAFKDEQPSIHIALCNGELKAFSAHNGNNKGMGWFGPMGTNPDLRGKGIGAILLKRCLNDMKEMGLAHAIIPWVGPIDFYAWHANARVDRVFWRYEKRLR